MTHSAEIVYDSKRWNRLRFTRDEALKLMKPFEKRHIETIVYGSIARGDVGPKSDIDIFLPRSPAPEIIESIIETNRIQISEREIIQATPAYAAKGYIHTGKNSGYSFSLVPLKTIEHEFYVFAGSLGFQNIIEDKRILGVDKKEGETAKKLGVGLSVIRDRIRVLNRRKKVGRTGVYIKRALSPGESFGDVYMQLARSRPALRRRIRS
jgi:predicted nucleotidyltransferase